MADYKLFTDGGSRGNPGPAAYGFVVYQTGSGLPNEALAQSGAGIVRSKCGNYIGVTTNNQAEYEGLIAGLKWIVEQQSNNSVDIFMDSLLIVNQVKGVYKMKNAALAPKLQEVRGLLAKLPGYSISYIPRAQNAVADSLVNQALDAHKY